MSTTLEIDILLIYRKTILYTGGYNICLQKYFLVPFLLIPCLGFSIKTNFSLEGYR